MTRTPMPSPPTIPGVVWRPIRMSDSAGLTDLARAIDATEGLEFIGGPEFWSWWLGQHRLDEDTLIGVAGAGRVIAAAGSWAQNTPSGSRAILWMDPHPDHLELDPFLLHWAETRGRNQLADATHPNRVIRISAEEHRSRRRSVIEDAGFEAARTFVEMERSLTDPIADPDPTPEVAVVEWRPALDESVRTASNAAFGDHWGSLPMDPETWGSMVVDEGVIRRDLSFVASAEGEVVALCLASVDGEDDPNCLLIDRVAVIPSWRRRGLATNLLLHSLRAGATAGLRRVTLLVDEESGWDAPEMYRRVGFTTTKRSVTYVKEPA